MGGKGYAHSFPQVLVISVGSSKGQQGSMKIKGEGKNMGWLVK